MDHKGRRKWYCTNCRTVIFDADHPGGCPEKNCDGPVIIGSPPLTDEQVRQLKTLKEPRL